MPVSDFQARVYAHVVLVPAGSVTSYAALARALHSSPRAVGGALRANPWAPAVPCHRVIAADGRLGGFQGAWDRHHHHHHHHHRGPGVRQSRKLRLLRDEGVHFAGDGRLVATPGVWFDGPWDTTESARYIARKRLI